MDELRAAIQQLYLRGPLAGDSYAGGLIAAMESAEDLDAAEPYFNELVRSMLELGMENQHNPGLDAVGKVFDKHRRQKAIGRRRQPETIEPRHRRSSLVRLLLWLLLFALLITACDAIAVWDFRR